MMRSVHIFFSEDDEVVKRFLDSQSNKSRSIRMLIQGFVANTRGLQSMDGKEIQDVTKMDLLALLDSTDNLPELGEAARRELERISSTGERRRGVLEKGREKLQEARHAHKEDVVTIPDDDVEPERPAQDVVTVPDEEPDVADVREEAPVVRTEAPVADESPEDRPEPQREPSMEPDGDEEGDDMPDLIADSAHKPVVQRRRDEAQGGGVSSFFDDVEPAGRGSFGAAATPQSVNEVNRRAKEVDDKAAYNREFDGETVDTSGMSEEDLKAALGL